jgi:hypothetical protein
MSAGGDCCEKSCVPNPSIPGSCTGLPAAACLDPRYTNSSSAAAPPPDVVPPRVTAPADYTTTCGAPLVAVTVRRQQRWCLGMPLTVPYNTEELHQAAAPGIQVLWSGFHDAVIACAQPAGNLVQASGMLNVSYFTACLCRT